MHWLLGELNSPSTGDVRDNDSINSFFRCTASCFGAILSNVMFLEVMKIACLRMLSMSVRSEELLLYFLLNSVTVIETPKSLQGT